MSEHQQNQQPIESNGEFSLWRRKSDGSLYEPEKRDIRDSKGRFIANERKAAFKKLNESPVLIDEDALPSSASIDEAASGDPAQVLAKFVYEEWPENYVSTRPVSGGEITHGDSYSETADVRDERSIQDDSLEAMSLAMSSSRAADAEDTSAYHTWPGYQSHAGVADNETAKQDYHKLDLAWQEESLFTRLKENLNPLGKFNRFRAARKRRLLAHTPISPDEFPRPQGDEDFLPLDPNREYKEVGVKRKRRSSGAIISPDELPRPKADEDFKPLEALFDDQEKPGFIESKRKWLLGATAVLVAAGGLAVTADRHDDINQFLFNGDDKKQEESFSYGEATPANTLYVIPAESTESTMAPVATATPHAYGSRPLETAAPTNAPTEEVVQPTIAPVTPIAEVTTAPIESIELTPAVTPEPTSPPIEPRESTVIPIESAGEANQEEVTEPVYDDPQIIAPETPDIIGPPSDGDEATENTVIEPSGDAELMSDTTESLMQSVPVAPEDGITHVLAKIFAQAGYKGISSAQLYRVYEELVTNPRIPLDGIFEGDIELVYNQEEGEYWIAGEGGIETSLTPEAAEIVKNTLDQK